MRLEAIYDFWMPYLEGMYSHYFEPRTKLSMIALSEIPTDLDSWKLIRATN